MVDLPGEILSLILSKLFGKDRRAFSLVCRYWNEVATRTSPYRSSTPCLMMHYHKRARAWIFYQHNSFYNMSFPQLQHAKIHCSKHGWLLMSLPDDTLFFFEPCNNQQVIKLPCPLRGKGAYTTVSFFDPPTSPNCVVIGIGTPMCLQAMYICVLKRGEAEWESNVCPTENMFPLSHGPPILHRGLVYFSDVKGNVARFNIGNRELVVKYNCLGRRKNRRRKFESKNIKEIYLFKFKEEEDHLFAVFVLHDERKVKVFKLSEMRMRWELVEDIGDKVLYLSYYSYLVDTARTKSMANTIYFPKFNVGGVAVFYSLSDNKYHSIDGIYSDDNVYDLKRLDHAAWLLPAPVTSQLITPWN